MIEFARILAAIATCAAIATPAAAAANPPAGGPANPAGLVFKPGTYRCELNRQVDVRAVGKQLESAVIRFEKKDYTMRAVETRTGALRYEDPASGMVWIVIVDKSMLLNAKQGRQLANECRGA